MNYTEQAIKKAIEGGWKAGWDESKVPFNAKLAIKTLDYEVLEWVFLDPLFWQSLGKVMGWGKHENNLDSLNCNRCGAPDLYIIAHPEETCGLDWKGYWHRFIDHLAEKKSPEDFFKELLK